jgi:Rrf2 family protein
MISRTSKYALGILGYLVRAGGERCRSGDIAEQTGIPANYLSKILNQLRKQGIVEGEKGWGGGFRLRREALEIPISEVLEIFDGRGSTALKECLFGLPRCDAANPCPLHSRWERIHELYREMLSETRIKDLGGASSL